jgi:glycosyltransferase involved in cell wall biosynthesis
MAQAPPTALPSISIITVCRNSEPVIRTCLESVASQTHPHVEHIVIDGASTDGTCDVVQSFPHVARLVSEPDQGLYDAMNKGVRLATGDVVGILNSDDFYPRNTVLEEVAAAFADPAVDATVGDVAFVRPDDLRRITRYCSARAWQPAHFAWGMMPPHPGFFVRRRHYEQLGTYRTDLAISADFDLLVRFLHTAALNFAVVSEPVVFMRTGGTSNASLARRWQLNRETARACRENGIRTNAFRLGLRYFWKLAEFLPRRSP